MTKRKLNKCLGTLIMLLSMAMFSLSLHAQAKNITGTITDNAGAPLIGASVKLKSASGAVSTDLNGRFSLSVPDAESALVVSYLGYVTQEVPVNRQTSTLSIRLESSSDVLSEIVVVGYGTQRKSDVTGSVVSIKNEELREVPATNIIDQLKGRLAGVSIQSNSTQPGASGQIRIRGERSLGRTQGEQDSQNQPLIIVDGIPYIGGSINDISPNDIAALDVLKDASATAIYGSRGASGVIIITTKRGRTGKSVMNYNAYFGVSNRTDEYNFFNGQEYAAFKDAAKVLNSVNPGVSNYGLTAAEVAGLANGTNTNWQDIIFRQGYNTDHELNLQGGAGGTQFSLSGGYHRDKGIVYGQSFERYSLRSTIDHQVSTAIKIGLNSLSNVSYTKGGGRFPVGGIIRFSPLVSPYNADGAMNMYPLLGSLDAATVNPLTIRDEETNTDRNRRLATFNSLYTEVKILKDLRYRANVGLIYNQSNGGGYTGPNTYYNSATSYAQSSESVNNSENWSYTVENLLTYDKTFLEKHRVTLTGLFSFEKNHNQSSSLSGVGIPFDYLQNYNLAQASTVTAGTGGFSERGLISYMGRLNYAFSDKYLLTATFRRDGSSVFPNRKYFNYPAFSLGWNIDRESFMESLGFINSLKLRGGYGRTSNQSVGAYSALGLLSANFYNYGATTANGYFVSSLANQNLTWEFTKSVNIGLDFGLFANRITGTVDVYNQKTSGILQQVSLPASNGATSVLQNLGKTKGKGLEISLSTDNIRSAKGFNWSTDFNISFNRNKIVELHDGLADDKGNNWFVGQPFNVIYDVKKIGIWQLTEAADAAKYGQLPGQIKVEDLDKNGAINAADRQILGNFQPDYDAGLTNRFSFKGVDLSFVAFARMGQTIVTPYLTADGSAQGYPFFGNSRVNQWKIDYWTPTNPTNEFPAPDAANDKQIYASTLAYRDGSFIKVRSINLGYTFSSKILQKAGMSGLRIYGTVSNPFILYSPLVRSGYGIDPEGNAYAGIVASTVSTANPTTGGGTNGGRVITTNLNNPATRSFQLGVNVKF